MRRCIAVFALTFSLTPLILAQDDEPKFFKRVAPGERAGEDEHGDYRFAVEPWTDPDDPAVIKLDPDDAEFEAWRTRIPQDDREPGLIKLNRYAVPLPNHAIKTFLGRHVALTPEDLKAAGVDVVIVGAAMETGFNPGSVGSVRVQCSSG